MIDPENDSDSRMLEEISFTRRSKFEKLRAPLRRISRSIQKHPASSLLYTLIASGDVALLYDIAQGRIDLNGVVGLAVNTALLLPTVRVALMERDKYRYVDSLVNNFGYERTILGYKRLARLHAEESNRLDEYGEALTRLE